MQMPRLIPALVALAFSSSAAASGFQLQNQTGSGNGNAFAGAAAAAEDAGTIIWNPAGMTYLPAGHNISAAGTLLYRDIGYSDKGSTTIHAGNFPLGTTDGGNAGGLSLIPAGYWSYSVSPSLFVGVGVSPTFGNKTEYGFDFVGRNAGFFAEITQFNINPSIAYKLNDKVALGFGFNIAHNTTHFKQGLAFLGQTTNYLDVKGDDWGYGWNIGAMFQLSPSTRIGVSYRSEIKFDLEGKQSTSVTGFGNPLLTNQDIKAVLKTPASASLAVSQKLSDRWEMLGDLGWTDWSVVNVIQLQSTSGTNLNALSYNFKDTWRIGFGANYQYTDKVKVRFGIAHDKSPVKSAADRTMTLPDTDRTWFSIGAKYQLSPKSSLDIGYTHIFFDKGRTEREVPVTGVGVVQTVRGEWNNSVDSLAIQYNQNF